MLGYTSISFRLFSLLIDIGELQYVFKVAGVTTCSPDQSVFDMLVVYRNGTTETLGMPDVYTLPNFFVGVDTWRVKHSNSIKLTLR